MTDYEKILHERRTRALLDARSVLERAGEEHRADLTGEEEQRYAALTDAVAQYDADIAEQRTKRERTKMLDDARAASGFTAYPSVSDPFGGGELRGFEQWLRGDKSRSNTGDQRDAFALDTRSMLSDGGASGGSLVVPTTYDSSIYSFMEAENAVRRIGRVIQTSNGETVRFPKVSSHGIGTQVIAQGTAIGGTDAGLDYLELSAYKYGHLVQVSTELVSDAAFDIAAFVAEDAGRSIGRITATAYATGSGSGAPNGVMTAATGSVVTGGSLITPTIEHYIDLQYAVVDSYRRNGSWLVNDTTAGTVRKMREDLGGTTGAFLWQPSLVAGQPDSFLGNAFYTDSNIATHGSNARVAAFGDFSSYYIRDAGAFRFERSDDFAFDTDLVSFRAILRTDSDLIDASGVKALIQRVS